MFLSKNTRVIAALLITIMVNITSVTALESRRSSLRSFGDYAQIINPLVTGVIASQDQGVGHFAIIYAQSLAATHGTKLISSGSKWKMSKRPSIKGKKDRYDGMPSGHTNSAWVSASYVRIFSKDHKYLSIPLYITAAVTGYSRIYAKEHTISQVIAGAALAEIITYVNNRLDWSNNYRSTVFYLGKDEISASFKIKF